MRDHPSPPRHALLLTLVALVALAARGRRAAYRAPQPVVAAAHRDAPPASAGLRRYAVELHSSLQMSSRASGPQEPVELHLVGALEVSALSADREGAALALRLVAPRLALTRAGRAGLTPAAAALLETALAQPFYVDRGVDGGVRAIRLPADLDPLASGVLRYLVAATQFTRPTGASRDQWEAREVDATGACVASYRRTGDRRYERARSRWTRPDVGDRRTNDRWATPIEGDGRARLALAADGELDAVDERDEIGSSAGEGALARTVSRVTLVRVAAGPAPGGAERARLLARWQRLRATSLAAATASPASAAARDRDLVAGASLTTLRAAVPEETETEAGARAAAEAQRRISALLRLDEGAVDEARRAVLGGGRAEEAAVLIASLGSVGSARCQRALAAVAESPGVAPETRAAAATELGLIEHPDRPTVDALRRMADGGDAEVRESATLALGAAAGAARRDGSPAADDGFEVLAARLARAADERETVLLLDALGNTGDPRLLPVAESLLTHPSDEVREAAVASARLVASPSADAFVAAQLRRRDDVALCVGAVRAASFRPLDPLAEALGVVLGADAQRALRARTVSMLGSRLRDSAMAAELLLQVATNDPDEDVREAARAWLRQLDRA